MNELFEPPIVLPSWALTVLVCPNCKRGLSSRNDRLMCEQCDEVGRWEDGILRFALPTEDDSIAWYKTVDGTHFYERTQIPFTMSSLDTPVYHSYLANLKPALSESVIVDVGAGDGRNTELWLEQGYQRVIAIDAIVSSLARFHVRIREQHPEWLGRVLLVECDARQLPVAKGVAELVLAIEVLSYLNQDYELGLAECRRLVGDSGRLMVSERAWEGALLTRLLYGGVQPMLEMRRTRDLVDGYENKLVHSRTFTEEELVNLIERTGLVPIERKGLSLLSLVLGYLRQQEKVSAEDHMYFQNVCDFLMDLGVIGHMRRTHVIIAGHK